MGLTNTDSTLGDLCWDQNDPDGLSLRGRFDVGPYRCHDAPSPPKGKNGTAIEKRCYGFLYVTFEVDPEPVSGPRSTNRCNPLPPDNDPKKPRGPDLRLAHFDYLKRFLPNETDTYHIIDKTHLAGRTILSQYHNVIQNYFTQSAENVTIDGKVLDLRSLWKEYKVASIAPSKMMVGTWTNEQLGYQAAWTVDWNFDGRAPTSSPWIYPDVAMTGNLTKIYPELDIYIVSEGFSNKRASIEGSLVMAEQMLQTHFGLKAPSWMGKCKFSKNGLYDNCPLTDTTLVNRTG